MSKYLFFRVFSVVSLFQMDHHMYLGKILDQSVGAIDVILAEDSQLNCTHIDPLL